MDIPTEKVCSKCNQPRDINRFAIDKSKKDGRHTVCKDCKSGYDKAYREIPENREKAQQYKLDNRQHCTDLENARRKRDPEKFRAKARQDYAENPERYKRNAKKYVESHRVQVAVGQKRWHKANYPRLYAMARQRREANAEEVAAYMRSYHEKNRDKIRDSNRHWRQKHPEQMRKSRKKWLDEHPEYPEIARHTRRARVANATIVDKFTLDEIGERDNWRCHICKKKVRRKDASIDHHFPYAKPGAIHGRQFVSLAHRWCNSSRGAGRLPAQLRLLP